MPESIRFLAPEHYLKSVRPAAAALWAWFDESGRPLPEPFIQEDLRTLARGENPAQLDAALYRSALRVVHAMGGDPERLMGRLRSRVLLGGAHGPRTAASMNRLLDLSVGEHARLLAQLAALTGSWQQEGAANIASGFELARSVANRGRDALGRLIVPQEELVARKTNIREWEGSVAPTSAGALLWKQSVRAKDALSRGSEILPDLPFLMRRAVKQSWLRAAELVTEAEKRQFDAWSGPIQIRPVAGVRSAIQSVVGRSAFRSR